MFRMNEDNYLKQCRICLENDNEEDMISPCLCNGSLLYVHRKCLDHWRSENSSNRCDICQFKYVIENIIYDKRKFFKYYLLIVSDFLLVILCVQPMIVTVAFTLKIFENEIKIKRIYPNLFNEFLVYYFVACLILLCILGLIVVLICLFFSIFDTTRPRPFVLPSNITRENIFYMFTFIGFLLAIFSLVMFLQSRMEYHKNKIWSKQQPNIFIIKDFTGKRNDLQLYKTNR